MNLSIKTTSTKNLQTQSHCNNKENIELLILCAKFSQKYAGKILKGEIILSAMLCNLYVHVQTHLSVLKTFLLTKLLSLSSILFLVYFFNCQIID